MGMIANILFSVLSIYSTNMNSYKELTRDSYDQTAESYQHNPAKLSAEVKIRPFLNHLQRGAKILDLGCGPGWDARYFIDRGFHVTGIDISSQMIELAQRDVPEADFKVMDIETVDFPPASFDAVWASASLLHVPKQKMPDVMKTISQLLPHNGLFYLSLKQGKGEVLEEDDRYGGVKKFWSYYQADELKAFLNDAGFEILEFDVHQKSSSHQTHPWISIISLNKNL